jgi:hypothetical protein
MRLREVPRYLLQIRTLLEDGPHSLRERYECALDEPRICVAIEQGDMARARELVRALSPASSGGPLMTTLRRYIDWTSGIRVEPSVWRPAPNRVPGARRQVIEQVLILCIDAALDFEHLRPTIAANLAAEALRLISLRCDADSSLGCLPAVLLGQIAYEQGRSTEAESLLRPRAAFIRASGTLECVLRAFTVLARLSLQQCRTSEGLAFMRDAEAIGRSRGWDRLVRAARAEHAHILLVTTHTTTTGGPG